MTTTTTTRPTSTQRVSTTDASVASASQTPRLTPHSTGWIIGGIALVAVVAVSAGTAYRAHESAQTPSPSADLVSTTVSDAAESGHGSSTALSTGSGLRLTASSAVTALPEVAGDTRTAMVAHGTSGSLADASGHAILTGR